MAVHAVLCKIVWSNPATARSAVLPTYLTHAGVCMSVVAYHRTASQQTDLQCILKWVCRIILGGPYNTHAATLYTFSLPTLDSRSHLMNSFGHTPKENDSLHIPPCQAPPQHQARHSARCPLSGAEQNDIESPLFPIWLGCSVIRIARPHSQCIYWLWVKFTFSDSILNCLISILIFTCNNNNIAITHRKYMHWS